MNLRELCVLLASSSAEKRQQGASGLLPELLRMARQVADVRSQQIEADVSQEAFVDLLSHFDGGIPASFPSDAGGVAAYLRTVVLHAWLDMTRRKADQQTNADGGTAEETLAADLESQRPENVAPVSQTARVDLERLAQDTILDFAPRYRGGALRTWAELKAIHFEGRTGDEVIRAAGESVDKATRLKHQQTYKNFRVKMQRVLRIQTRKGVRYGLSADALGEAISLFLLGGEQQLSVRAGSPGHTSQRPDA